MESMKEKSSLLGRCGIAAMSGLLALSLAGCAGTSSTGSEDTGSASVVASTTTETEDDATSTVSDTTSSDVSDSTSSDGTYAECGLLASSLQLKVDLGDLVAIDDENVTITFSGYRLYESSVGAAIEIDATYVNNSNSAEYSIRKSSTIGCSVDGVTVYPTGMGTTLESGETYETTIIIYDVEDLVEEGVSLTDIHLAYSVVDTDNVLSYVSEGDVHIYPYGEDAATTFVREDTEDDVVLVDNDYIKVVAIGYTYNGYPYDDDIDYTQYLLELYIENKTDTSMKVRVSDVTINGESDCESSESCLVHSGLSIYQTVNWTTDQLEGIGITSEDGIETIELTLTAYDSTVSTAKATFYVDGLTATLEP